MLTRKILLWMTYSHRVLVCLGRNKYFATKHFSCFGYSVSIGKMGYKLGWTIGLFLHKQHCSSPHSAARRSEHNWKSILWIVGICWHQVHAISKFYYKPLKTFWFKVVFTCCLLFGWNYVLMCKRGITPSR